MAETYCGKSCEGCTYKQELKCNGCKIGPGREYGGECRLAQCCREKGHEECETCSYKRNCGMWIDRGSMPKQRLEKLAEKKEEKELMERRAPFLGKWLWILFWLVVPSEIAGVMVNENVVEILPVLETPGQVLSTICTIAYGLILLRIASENESYKIAGVCSLGADLLNALVVFFVSADAIGIGIVCTIIIMVVSLVMTYYEYKAHAEVVRLVDSYLSEKWKFLWKLHLYILFGIIGSIVLMLIIPLLGALAVIALGITAVVASILKLVYLYRTAQAFRRYK